MNAKRVYIALRSLTDRVFAVVALLAFSPIMLVIATVVRVHMGPPVLFRQVRIGTNGRPFEILKFRTMVVDAERLGGGYMTPEMQLVPPVGRFLRRTSLDELPQLANILKGDLALIGPRPAIPSQYERYTARQARRVSVPQGITGLAQVLYRNEAPWSVRIEADLEYIDRMGPLLDLQILLKTVGRVSGGSGIRLDQSAAEVDDLPRDPDRKESDAV